MAFVSARTLSYKNIQSPDGTPIAIEILGEIVDSEIAEPYLGTCSIDGDAFAALPPADPALDGTPADLRYQAIMGHVAAFVVSAYAAWVEAYASRPVVVSRSPEEVAMLPVMTELPGE